MAKKITLETLATQMATGFASVNGRMDQLESVVEKGFAAAKDDIADLKSELKGDIARLLDQVNSIEAQLKHGRYETRLGNLEEKVFGAPRR
jgi:division protein CdvB (Snf7/Vps24/ESCRT-III family)